MQRVVFLSDLALGKRRDGVEVGLQVAAAALDEVARQRLAVAPVPIARQVLGQTEQAAIQQPEQRAEGLFLAAVRGCGDQQKVTTEAAVLAGSTSAWSSSCRFWLALRPAPTRTYAPRQR